MKLFSKIFSLSILMLYGHTIGANTALIEAAKKGDATRLRTLLATKNHVNSTNQHGATPLHFAAYKGHIAALKTLLAHMAAVDNKTKKNSDFELGNLQNNKGGTTALMLAVFKGYLNVIQELLEKGADVNAQDDRGQTPLHYAILADTQWPNKPLSATQQKIIRLLLAQGADARIEDEQGNTPLYYYSFLAGLVHTRTNDYIFDADAVTQDALYQEMAGL